MVTRNVILTGVPRSGTTLSCHLLNKLPDTVALHEPMKVRKLGELESHTAVCDTIQQFFQQTRTSIESQGRAVSKHIGGQIPDNHIASEFSSTGFRLSRADKGEIAIDKPLSPDFLLIIKHPSAFTAVLESLHQRFPTYAVVRNPLSILASWNSVEFPVETGHAPVAEQLDGRLREMLAGIKDKTVRQLRLLSWFFETYRRVLPDRSVVRYEEIIRSGGKALRVITPQAESLAEPLASKNQNPLYSQEQMQQLGAQLLASDGAYWDFYSKASVQALLETS